jgi:hypothetical protein
VNACKQAKKQTFLRLLRRRADIRPAPEKSPAKEIIMKRFALLFCLLNFFVVGKALALCVEDPRAGTWTNIDANTPSIKRVNFQQVCNDVILCPVGQPCTQPDNRPIIQLFGSCIPTLCDWGKKRLDRYDAFWDRTVYDFSFKTTYVWVHYYPSTKQLLVVTQDRYKDGRPDKDTYNYFRKI